MRQINRLCAGLLVLSLLLALAALAQSKPYVGNKSSKKFHVVDCEWAKKMNPKNRVEFASVEEAEKPGYIACKICRPKK